MLNALVLGRARSVWDDIKTAEALCKFDLVIAVNSIGVDYPGRVDHWVSFHLDLLPWWAEKRVKLGRSRVTSFWTSLHTGSAYYEQRSHIQARYIPCQGGSSGLIATMVGLKLAHHVVLAGVPMDVEAGQYDTDKPWPEAKDHRASWERYLPILKGRVKSCSGWTQTILGAPTTEWLRHETDKSINARNS